MASHDDIVEFILTHPLYTKFSTTPKQRIALLPQQLFSYCDQCARETPFKHSSDYYEATNNMHSCALGSTYIGTIIRLEVYQCLSCDDYCFSILIERDPDNKWMRKLGQLPEHTIDIDRDVSEFLGDSEDFFRKGQISLNHGYGIGACAYIRRVLEDITEPLLIDIKNMLEETNAPQDEIRAIQSAIEGRGYTEKARIAQEALPSSLVISGENPFKSIHDLLSIQIHGLSDADGIKMAHRALVAIRFIVKGLARTRRDREEYERAIKQIEQDRFSE